MPRQQPNAHSGFIFSRAEIEYEFLKIKDQTKNCNKYRICYACHRAEYIDFEYERKCFYSSNADVKFWKKRYQGGIKRLVISPVFNI